MCNSVQKDNEPRSESIIVVSADSVYQTHTFRGHRPKLPTRRGDKLGLRFKSFDRP